MPRSIAFTEIEEQFLQGTKEHTIQTALNEVATMSQCFDQDEKSQIIFFSVLLIGARIGVAGREKLNYEEMDLIDEVFGGMLGCDTEPIYNIVGTEIVEEDYAFVNDIIHSGSELATAFLYYVMSFAFIDGFIEDEVADRLDDLFELE